MLADDISKSGDISPMTALGDVDKETRSYLPR